MCEHKAWKLKYDITEMATATNEVWIGWLLENCHLMGDEMKLLIAKDLNLLKGIFLMEKMSTFLGVG